MDKSRLALQSARQPASPASLARRSRSLAFQFPIIDDGARRDGHGSMGQHGHVVVSNARLCLARPVTVVAAAAVAVAGSRRYLPADRILPQRPYPPWPHQVDGRVSGGGSHVARVAHITV